MLSTLRTWLRGLFGGEESAADESEAQGDDEDTGGAGSAETSGEAAPASEESSLTCPICGTSNPADATACSLCGSSDLRPATAGDQQDGDDPASGASSATAAGADGGDAGEGGTDDPDAGEGGDGGLAGAGTRTERVADAPDADRLSEVRAEGELLVRHRDRWERLPHEGRFRVDLPDGERVVDSRDEVRELLRTVDEGT